MKFIVFDTETTGLPKTKFISPDTLNLWPYIVQFSYIIYDTSLNDIIKSVDYFVKIPENILILNEISEINGVTNELCEKKGIYIGDIFSEFFRDLESVDSLVGHNIEFDINMVKIELLRIINNKNCLIKESKLCKKKLYFISNYKNIICTLKNSIEFCNIQSIDKSGKPYLKYPRLKELHEKLFNESPKNLHNSFNDIFVTLRCFMKLQYNNDLLENCISFIKFYHENNIL
jgi:DNA polymerase III epsilon subunit-like protein